MAKNIQKIKHKDINCLISAEYNPRQLKKEQYQNIKDSIQRFGFVDPVIINKNKDRKNIVIGGHQRIKVAKDLKYTEIPCLELDLTLDKEKELNIRLNKNVGEWDYDILANLFDFNDLMDWGFTEDDLAGFAPELEEEGLTDDDDIPEDVESVCKLGDIWKLGNHRLLCGDSTKKENIELLLDGNKVDISFTSPPYNAGQTPTETKSNKKSKYRNDTDSKSKDEYLSLLSNFTTIALDYSEYVFVNIQSLSGNKIALIEYLNCLKDNYADTIIWDKQTSQPAMAKNVLNSQFEYVHCFSNKSNRSLGVKEFRGTLSNVISISKQCKNKVKNHNATFPVEFALFFVSNFSNNSVLDQFLGSGTTLIACEKTNRVCYGMELDEHYCDVIINRWEQFTGKKAELINGKT